MCNMCGSSVPYMHTAACCGCIGRSKSLYFPILADLFHQDRIHLYVMNTTMLNSPGVVMTEVTLSTRLYCMAAIPSDDSVLLGLTYLTLGLFKRASGSPSTRVSAARIGSNVLLLAKELLNRLHVNLILLLSHCHSPNIRFSPHLLFWNGFPEETPYPPFLP